MIWFQVYSCTEGYWDLWVSRKPKKEAHTRLGDPGIRDPNPEARQMKTTEHDFHEPYDTVLL